MIGIETVTENSGIFLGNFNKTNNNTDNEISFDKVLENSIENDDETSMLSEIQKAINKLKCKYDLDGDGRVTKEEIEEALGKKKAEDEIDEILEEANSEDKEKVDTRKITNLDEEDLDITKIAPMQSDKIMAIFKNMMNNTKEEVL